MFFSKKMKRVLAFVLALALVVSLNNTSASAAKKYVKSMSVKAKATVEAGKTVKVKATVKVSGKASAAVKVSSSNKAVATVSVGKPNKKGVSTIKIKGVSAGSTKITVKTKAKNKKKALISKKISVTVTDSSVTDDSSTKPVVTTTTQDDKSQTPTTQENKTEVTTTQAVRQISALSVKLNQESIKIAVSTSQKLTAEVYPKNSTDPVIWSSSNPKIAAVSADGVVTAGTEEGTATITAKAGDYSAKCNVIVYIPFTADDYTVEEGNKTVHIDFTATDDETANLYKDRPGFTVNGRNVKGDVPCESYKYTFKRLPETLEDIQQIKLDNACAPMAAMICAIHTVDTSMSSAKFATVEGNTLLPMFNYIGGPKCNLLDTKQTSPLLHAQFLAGQMFEGRGGAPYLKDCYFDGATPENGYTPTAPYSFTMYVGPYYIPAKTGISGNRPETYMSLIEFAGDDSQRYIDVYHSSDGNWYALNSSPYETFKQLMGKPKAPNAVIEW